MAAGCVFVLHEPLPQRLPVPQSFEFAQRCIWRSLFCHGGLISAWCVRRCLLGSDFDCSVLSSGHLCAMGGVVVGCGFIFLFIHSSLMICLLCDDCDTPCAVCSKLCVMVGS